MSIETDKLKAENGKIFDRAIKWTKQMYAEFRPTLSAHKLIFIKNVENRRHRHDLRNSAREGGAQEKRSVWSTLNRQTVVE